METHVLNNADIHIQKDQAIEIKGDAVYQIENGSLTETARKIVYKVGSSTLTLKGSGAFLNAAKINLNCGGGAAEAKTEGLGAVGSGAAGNAGNNNLSGANMGNMDTSTQSDEARTNDTHDTEKTVEKLFPTLSLDLTKNTPPKNFSFVTPYGILSLTLTLNGTIDFKKLGNTSNLVIDGKSYRIEGKNILGNFFSYLQLEKFTPKEVVIGSTINGEFSSTTVELITPTHTRFIASSTPIQKTYEGWEMSGNLGYTLDVYQENNPTGALPYPEKIWQWIENNFNHISLPEKAGIIALGVGAVILTLPEDLIVALITGGSAALLSV